jgi:hypothetical protein
MMFYVVMLVCFIVAFNYLIDTRNRHYKEFVNRRGGYQPKKQFDLNDGELSSSKVAQPPKRD